MDANLVITIIVAVVASVPGIYAVYAGRNKNNIDASASAAAALRSYSDEVLKLRAELLEVRTELDRMRAEREQAQRKVAAWEDGIRRLIAQLVSVQQVPVWTPDIKPIKTNE